MNTNEIWQLVEQQLMFLREKGPGSAQKTG